MQRAAIFLGILCGFIIYSLFSLRLAPLDLKEVGLGMETTSKSGYFEGNQVSSKSSPKKTFACWEQYRAEDKQIALWLGASQLHAINKDRRGDRLAVEYSNTWAHEERMKLGYVQTSAPNANLHELLAIYQVYRQHNKIPDWLIIALTYDDLREEQLRDTILADLSPLDEASLAEGGDGMAELQKNLLKLGAANHEVVARNATKGTAQDRLEVFLTGHIEKFYPGYRFRDKAMGQIQVSVQAMVARAFSKVDSRRVPEISRLQKAWNHSALMALLDLARHDGCTILIYKPPHRPSSGPFYHNRSAYDAYFDQINLHCADQQDLHYLDLETIVPQEFWGLTNWGRPDVFHFTDEGHQRLGRAIHQFLRKALQFASPEPAHVIQ